MGHPMLIDQTILSESATAHNCFVDDEFCRLDAELCRLFNRTNSFGFLQESVVNTLQIITGKSIRLT
jgi:hypothetical protein